MSVQDFLGNEIKVGDEIVYPVHRGSDLYLRKMRVEAIDGQALLGRSQSDPRQRRIRIKNLHTVIVVKNAPVRSEM